MKNVLLVDSNQAMLHTLTEILKSQGGFIDVFTTTNTKQAFEVLKNTAIDIVISAIRLPKVDGFRLVARLTKEYPAIKVIVMTKGDHPLLRASIRHFSPSVHLDMSHDIGMLTKRVFTELQIDYGGRVRGINLSSFLQMMELERCSCTLQVNSKDLVGTLWLRDGNIIAAKSSREEGKDAALDIISWKNVYIDIDYTPHQMEQQISLSLMRLLLESGQRKDDIRSSSKNHRDHKRYGLLVALDYDIKNLTRQCLLHDISLDGAYLETAQELETGEKISLTLTSPALQCSCSINAVVVRKDGRGVGVRFKINSSEQQQVIKAMINNSIRCRRPDDQEEIAQPLTE